MDKNTMAPKIKKPDVASPPSKWPRLAAIAATVATVAAIVANVDKIGKTLQDWFGGPKPPSAQTTVVVQITTETLLKAAAQAAAAASATSGTEKQEAEVAQKDLQTAAEQLRATISVATGQVGTPAWLSRAFSEVSQTEIAGPQHNPRIVEYLRSVGLGKNEGGDEITWNSAFVNWALSQSGVKGTGSGLARSWLTWGIELPAPKLGAVAIFQRGLSPAFGTACFYVSETADQVICLGGNFLDSVRLTAIPKSSLLGYRWPSGV
jgi:uncharacterized protein (TIGR02594 family)